MLVVVGEAMVGEIDDEGDVVEEEKFLVLDREGRTLAVV